MADEWYCRISGEESGPISAPELKVMAAKGLLSPQDAVRRGEKGTWVEAARVKGLFSQAERSSARVPAEPLSEGKPTDAAPSSPSGFSAPRRSMRTPAIQAPFPPPALLVALVRAIIPAQGRLRYGTKRTPLGTLMFLPPKNLHRLFPPPLTNSISWGSIPMPLRLVP